MARRRRAAPAPTPPPPARLGPNVHRPRGSFRRIDTPIGSRCAPLAECCVKRCRRRDFVRCAAVAAAPSARTEGRSAHLFLFLFLSLPPPPSPPPSIPPLPIPHLPRDMTPGRRAPRARAVAGGAPAGGPSHPLSRRPRRRRQCAGIGACCRPLSSAPEDAPKPARAALRRGCAFCTYGQEHKFSTLSHKPHPICMLEA